MHPKGIEGPVLENSIHFKLLFLFYLFSVI